MRTPAIVCICAALTLSGCDSGSESAGYFEPAADAYAIGAAVGLIIVVGVGVGVYDAQHRKQSRFEFKPGVNIKAPKEVGRDKTFEVKVAVADAKAKPLKEWWSSERQPRLSVTATDGAALTPLKTEVRKEWYVAQFRAPQAGACSIAVSSPIPDETGLPSAVPAELSRPLVVK